MSGTGQRLPYAQAFEIAQEACETLRPHCARIEIAGSIRRQGEDIGDIEVVAIPRQIPRGLFGDELEVDPEFCAAVHQWPKILGEPTGKHTQRVLPGNVMLDLYLCDAENWGLILAIRTGSAMFSHEVLARTWVKQGYTSVKGRLTRGGVVTPIPEETDLWRILKLPWMEPWAREV
jgi:DNA polymerase/3'-5' exonuclease PolX